MRKLVLIAAVAVSGCATTANGLYESHVELVVTSGKEAGPGATCVAERLAADVELRTDGAKHWLIRSNWYGSPIHRWDFTPTETGSRAELRTSININSGETRVRECA